MRYTIRILSIVVVFFISLEVLTQLFGPDVPVKKPESGRAALPVPEQKPAPKSVPQDSVVEVEMVSQKGAPEFATPIVLTDHRGKAKWTVSIPPDTLFPLTPDQYVEMCAKCRQVATRAQYLRSQAHGLQQLSLISDSPEHGFIDVLEAQKAGYLVNHKPGWEDTRKPVCKKSLTFVLESKEAGLGKSLLMLWTAYGLAQKEGRAFFIDDTRWAYGKYSDIFHPPPIPDCAPPPAHEIVPCPRQARHLVASAATADELFSVLATSSTSEPPSESQERISRKKLFNLARQGYDTLFHLTKDDSNYVETRIRQLAAKRVVPKTKGQQMGMAVGVHVRRGDRHPFEYQYSRSYLPLNMYSDLARATIDIKFNHSGPLGGEDKVAKKHSIMILASDDPMVYESQEIKGAYPAQGRIKLAHKQMIEEVTHTKKEDKSVMHKYVDETFGWEGGFYAAMFWNLGIQSSVYGGEKTKGKPLPEEALRLRSLVGRAYMMDLAVLADASDMVICTVSSAGCRLLAVMMGWESAIDKGNWMNIDGGFGWMGVLE